MVSQIKRTLEDSKAHILWYDDLEEMTEFLPHHSLQHWGLRETTDQEQIGDV